LISFGTPMLAIGAERTEAAMGGGGVESSLFQYGHKE